jgi:hypothetical protein
MMLAARKNVRKELHNSKQYCYCHVIEDDAAIGIPVSLPWRFQRAPNFRGLINKG